MSDTCHSSLSNLLNHSLDYGTSGEVDSTLNYPKNCPRLLVRMFTAVLTQVWFLSRARYIWSSPRPNIAKTLHNIILHSTSLRFSELYVPFRLYNKNFLRICYLPFAICMSYPSHPFWFGYRDNIWRRLKNSVCFCVSVPIVFLFLPKSVVQDGNAAVLFRTMEYFACGGL
jgi:hypothetical protein